MSGAAAASDGDDDIVHASVRLSNPGTKCTTFLPLATAEILANQIE